jgi:hypothetical protein
MGSLARALGGIGAGVLAAAAATATACTIFNGLTPTTTADAAVEASADAARDATLDVAPQVDADNCNHATPAAPPAQSSPGNGAVTFVAALRTITGIEPGDAGVVLGFDLDGVCTCPGPPSCRSQATPPAQNCDQPGGRDLQGDGLLSIFDQAYSAMSPYGNITQHVAEGRIGILFYIGDYNGQPDDTQVTVAIYASDGLPVVGDAGTSDAGVPAVPLWDGTDRWLIDSDSFITSAPLDGGGFQYAPTYVTGTAYVSQSTFVANLPALVLRLPFGEVPFQSVVATAKIVPDANGGYDLTQGQLVARMSTATIFHVLAQAVDSTGQFLCGTNPMYQELRTAVCQGADIMDTPSADNTDAGCNAISITVGFTASAAQMGAPSTLGPAVAGCDGAIDDCVP